MLSELEINAAFPLSPPLEVNKHYCHERRYYSYEAARDTLCRYFASLRRVVAELQTRDRPDNVDADTTHGGKLKFLRNGTRGGVEAERRKERTRAFRVSSVLCTGLFLPLRSLIHQSLNILKQLSPLALPRHASPRRRNRRHGGLLKTLKHHRVDASTSLGLRVKFSDCSGTLDVGGLKNTRHSPAREEGRKGGRRLASISLAEG